MQLISLSDLTDVQSTTILIVDGLRARRFEVRVIGSVIVKLSSKFIQSVQP